MFDTSKMEKINDEAYIIRRFLTPEFTDELFKESEDLSKSGDVETREHDKIQLLKHIVDQRVVDLVDDYFKDSGYEIKYPLHWFVPRNTWFAIHRDEEAPDPTPMKKEWGLVIYLADMDGGELFYPTNNTWTKPDKGDLVIHTASIPHGALAVNGDNKRFITFVAYNPDVPVNPEEHLSMQEEAAITWKMIEDSKEWLSSDIGQKFKKEYNWGPDHQE
jgi:hypothetical protein